MGQALTSLEMAKGAKGRGYEQSHGMSRYMCTCTNTQLINLPPNLCGVCFRTPKISSGENIDHLWWLLVSFRKWHELMIIEVEALVASPCPENSSSLHHENLLQLLLRQGMGKVSACSVHFMYIIFLFLLHFWDLFWRQVDMALHTAENYMKSVSNNCVGDWMVSRNIRNIMIKWQSLLANHVKCFQGGKEEKGVT